MTFLVPMMCAKVLRHVPEEEMNWFMRRTQQAFDAIIRRYGIWLDWVLDRQALTLLVALLTVCLTVFLYIVIPKGFFPVQDTGLIQGISEAPPAISFAAMAERQQALAAAVLKDPDVVSLSSFIGVDGTNATLNEGRFLINLKPRDERSLDASAIIRRLQGEIHDVAGIDLYMQPVQDLTIDATVSRTQYQFALQDANLDEFNTWVPKLMARLQQIPQIADVATNFGENGLSAYINIDRSTAGRFGITPATVDNALYDAFGQRIVSTIFTQSNQYRVILEATPEAQQTLSSARPDLPALVVVEQRPGAVVGDRDGWTADRAARGQPYRPISVGLDLVQPGARGLARHCGRPDQEGRGGGRAADQHDHQLPGRRARLPGGAQQRDHADRRGDRHGLHRAGRAL